VQLGEICFTESTCSVGPELELDIAPPALSSLPLISTLLFTYLVRSDLLPPVSLYWLAEDFEAEPAVPAAPPAAPAPLLEPDPSLAFARMKLSDFEEEAAPPAGAPGAPAPLVPVADAESACRQPVTVMALLLLSSFWLGA
jgi:hypothetical protein